jgi:hypothetical protein
MTLMIETDYCACICGCNRLASAASVLCARCMEAYRLRLVAHGVK